MSFSFGPPAGESNKKPAPSGFSFGSPPATTTGGAATNESTNAPSGGFSFGSANAAPAPAVGGSFNFGGAAPVPAATGESQPTTGGFGFGGFGGSASTTTAATSAVNFGAKDDAPAAAGISFGAFSPSATTTAPAFGATAKEDGKPTAVSFGFGSPPATSTTAAPSFGASAAAAAGQDDGKPAAVNFGESTGAVAAASTFPGLSAGGTTTAVTFGATETTTPKATGGAFSFGNAATTPATPLPATPGPPVPVATPGVSETPLPTAAAAAVTTVATLPPPATSKEPVRLEYQTMTVEQILNTFQQEMEKDTKVYLEEARRVAEYDAILRDSQRDLNTLMEQTRRCLIEQQEVEQTLVGIGTLQGEVDRTLGLVELNVDELFTASQAHLMPVDADFEREAAYKMAQDVDVRLQMLQTSLELKLAHMDEAQEQALEGLGDVAKIVQILNQHHNSLAALEDAGRRMEYDISQVNRVLTQYKQ